MKKFITIILIILLSGSKINAQITRTNNTATVNPEYCGWDGTGINTKDLDIKNLFSGEDINFTTTTSGGTSAQRMTILGATNPGYVGIGLAAPTNKLHLDAGSLQITNATTGNTSGKGLLIGQATSGSTTVEINNQESSAMKLMTNSTSRLCIDNSTGGYVGIGNGFTAPTSRLHIRENTGSVDTWLQLTSNSTTHNAGNGLRIGVLDASKDVEIKQQENADLNFYTNATPAGASLTGSLCVATCAM